MAWKAPTFKLNLLKILEKAYPDPKVQDKLRPRLAKSDFKTLYGNRVIDEIVNRTRELGIDMNGKKFKAYSTEYKKSLVFQVYKEGTMVDLTLTGEMLESLRSKSSKFDITVYLQGENNQAKAAGHMTGKYGNSKKIKKREFLGLPEKEITRLFKESIEDLADPSKFTMTELSI